jgi:hypothetical protein
MFVYKALPPNRIRMLRGFTVAPVKKKPLAPGFDGKIASRDPN